jgi:ribosomal protein L37AE/L43A
MSDNPSNWTKATLLTIVCPRCSAMNIPRATPTIDRNQHGLWECSQCGHGWRLEPQ